ncbi:dTMP kinase [Amycolatopsis vastitatis]|uniref:dTMP kinase n=1 Tax=Amycolatopsis vastitatis TaxID=1905142 RepID=UPI0026A7B7EB
MTTRLPGTLVTFEGPGGVGKTTITELVAGLLDADGVPVHATTQPSRTPLGELARHGTYRDMAFACLCAADRHHQLATESSPPWPRARSCSATATSYRH